MIATVLFPLKLIALDTPSPAPTCAEGDIKQMVSCYAKKNGVPDKLAHYVVEKESHYNPDETGDMEITCKTGINKGQPVRARGLVQITDCYYPEVTDEQAFDPNFNLEFGMKLMKDKKTCMSQFTTCRNYYRS